MEPVQDVAGVTEMGVDGSLVGLRAIGHDDLDAAAPAWALFDEEPRQRSGVAVLDHGQDLAGVAVLNDGDVAVAFAHRGLINQQHPAPLAAAVLGHQRRPHVNEVLDQMPVETMAANHGSDGHDLGVGDELASQPPGQAAFELAVIFEVACVAVGAAEPPSDPHQRHTASAHRQIPDLAPTPVVHRSGLEPAERTARPRPSRRHLNLEPGRRVNQNREYANETQVQPHPHSVNSHRGLSGSAV